MSTQEHWLAARIERIENLSPSIRLFEIAAPEGIEPWRPGAHLGVRVRCNGRVEQRHYSLLDLSRDQDDGGRYRIAVKRVDDGFGGSRYLWSLAAGSAIEITQPNDDFELGLDAPAYLLLAGGIGVTPLLSMAHQLARRGAPVQFHYAVRSRDEAVFADLLRAWLGDALHLHVSAEGSRLDVAAAIGGSREDVELYLCGPLGLLDTARSAWRAAGRAAAHFRFESFGSGGHYANQPFTVALPRYGLELAVPARQSLLATLEAAGVELLSGCRRGECGLCAVDVLACDTALDHRDVFFSDAEKAAGARMCTCVSRPSGGRLVIDTDYRGREAQTAS
jgi:ferredoxin-NADP reductase